MLANYNANEHLNLKKKKIRNKHTRTQKKKNEWSTNTKVYQKLHSWSDKSKGRKKKKNKKLTMVILE